jgi:hypothetical protein
MTLPSVASLFDPDSLEPASCRVLSCSATRLQGESARGCAYDLQAHLDLHSRDWPRRPRQCLNAHDPATAGLPF